MKQTFYAIGILMFIAVSQATAQKNETALLTQGSLLGSQVTASAAKVEVSGSTLKNFKKEFSEASDADWVAIKDGFRAYFRQDDILTAVDYNKRGKLYSVIRYGKALITADIEKMLAAKFPRAGVKEVSEVKIADFATRVYIIVLQDEAAIKTVQVMDDEVKVISEIPL